MTALTFRVSTADRPDPAGPSSADAEAGQRAALARLRYELTNSGIAAHFAAEPGEPGTKASAELLPLLVVVVPILAEARKVVQILAEAKTARSVEVRATIEDGKSSIIIRNAPPEDLTSIIEGHYRIAARDHDSAS
jgi:hypothetical protein